MNVRTASFRDLGRIEQLYREATAQDGEQPVFAADSPVPQTTLVRLWYAVSKTLSGLVPLTEASDALYVAEDMDGTLLGFVQAQRAASAKAWQIVNLCVVPSGRGAFAGERLLTHLCNEGMSRGVTRYYVRVPLDHSLTGLFVEQGFTQYATEQILFRDDIDATPRVVLDNGGDVASPLRVARREDVAGIHLLYLRTTPSHVAQLEGPSLKVWQAGFCNGWLERLGRDDVRHLVAERAGVVAWVGIRPPSPSRPALLGILCEGQDAALRDSVVDAALASTPPGPTSCVLRHYDSELIRTLQHRGFEIFGTQLLLVRDLALKVRLRPREPAKPKKSVLVHARLARTVPASTIHVLSEAQSSASRSSPTT